MDYEVWSRIENLQDQIYKLEARIKTLEQDIQYKKDAEPEKWVYGVDY